MSTELVKSTDIIRGKFIDFMSIGIDDAVKANRDKLESFIREEINIEKAKKVIDDYKVKNNNTRVSPETFFTLSLIDNIPDGVDFRFSPDFKLDKVVFKGVNSTNHINIKEVEYRKEIADLLKLQMSPDLIKESYKSIGNLKRVTERIEIFDNAYRSIMNSFQNTVQRKIRTHTMSNKTSLYFKLAAECFINHNKNLSNRIEIPSLIHTDKTIQLCSEFIRVVGKNVYYSDKLSHNILSSIILNKIFPKLSERQVGEIIKKATDLSNPINYTDIFNIVNKNRKHKVSRGVLKNLELSSYIFTEYEKHKKIYNKDCDEYNSSKKEYEDDRDSYHVYKVENMRKVRKLTTIINSSTAKESSLRFKISDLNSRTQKDNIKINSYQIQLEKKVKEIKLASEKRYKIKDDLRFRGLQVALAKEKLSRLRSNLAKVKNRYNLILDKYSYSQNNIDERVLIKRVRSSYLESNYQDISPETSVDTNMFVNFVEYCIAMRKEITLFNKNLLEDRLTDSEYTESFIHSSVLYSFCEDVIAIENLKDKMAGVESSNVPLQELYSDFNRFLVSSSVDKIITKRNINIALDGIKENLKRKLIYKFLPHVKVYKYEVGLDGVRRKVGFLDNYNQAILENDVLVKFCETEEAWVSSKNAKPLIEVVSGKDISNISGLSTAAILNFLYKDQVPEGFFNGADYILFHNNMLLVMINDQIINLAPSNGYKQFVLKELVKDGQYIKEEDIGDVQLNRFKSILDSVFKEKTKLFFNEESGSFFIDKLSKSTGIKFLDGYTDKKYEKENVTHKLSWGSLSESEKQNFSRFVNIYSFIFPKKIEEIHLNLISSREKAVPTPTQRREFLFFIENQRDYNSRSTDFKVSLNDIILLGMEDGFYHTILIERAFVTIFNRDILCNNDMLEQFIKVVGQKAINVATQHFRLKGRTIGESQILRRLFAENCMWLIQNEKDKITEQMAIFLGSIFKQNIQIEQGMSIRK